MTLEHKARWVKDGHLTFEPDRCTYAGVVSRESIRIAFTYASLSVLTFKMPTFKLLPLRNTISSVVPNLVWKMKARSLLLFVYYMAENQLVLITGVTCEKLWKKWDLLAAKLCKDIYYL